MRRFIKSLLRLFSIEIRRIQPPVIDHPGSDTRPISNLKSFLEDIKTREFSPKGIIDVGANHGHWAQVALDVFPNTPIILIEPQDEMENILIEFVEENPNCRYIKAGAGRKKGELIQTIWEDLAGSSFLPEIEPAKLDSREQRKTRIVTIDSLLKQWPDFQPDLVKLDIQGFELEALAGAKDLFDDTEVFILETSLYPFMPNQPLTREVISYMAERHYEMYDITEFLRRPSDGALGSVDLAFVKSDGMFRQSFHW